MSRVAFTPLIQEITGKLAGSVFQDSYGGYQIRTRVSPRNPQSTYQQLRRGEFGYISSLWRTLTDPQRQTFIDASSTPPAALNLFIESNVNLSLIDEDIINTYTPSNQPPGMDIVVLSASPEDITIQAISTPVCTPTYPTDSNGDKLTDSNGDIIIDTTDNLQPPSCQPTYPTDSNGDKLTDSNGDLIINSPGGGETPTIVPPGCKLLIFVTDQKPVTRIFTNPSEFSPVITFDEGTDLSIPVNIITDWQSRYGVLQANKRLCLKSAVIDKSNGHRSAEFINCTNSEEMPKFVKIFTDTSEPSTSGTGATDLFSFNVPPNSLVNDGDILQMIATGSSSSGGGNGTLTPHFNGVGSNVTIALGASNWTVIGRIQRKNSTTALISWYCIKNASTQIVITTFDNTVDWETNIELKLNATAPTSGEITMATCDVNKELT